MAKQGGNVANVAKVELQTKTGEKVVSEGNAKSILPDPQEVKKMKPKKGEV